MKSGPYTVVTRPRKDRPESTAVYLLSGRVPVARAWLLDLDQPGAYLSHLLVRPGHRRRGAGLAMMHALARIVKVVGCKALSLHVYCANTPALKLYESAGYFVACTTNDPEDRAYLMVRQLPSKR